MQPNSPANKIFDTIYTFSELQLFYKEIDTIVSSLFKSEGQIEGAIHEIVSPEKAENILEYLHTLSVDLKNPVALQEALLKLKSTGNQIPVVHMTLAFEPTNTVLKSISLWFLRREQKKVILDLTLERQILGGAFISYDGLYKDYTLKTKLDKYFSKEREIKNIPTQIT